MGNEGVLGGQTGKRLRCLPSVCPALQMLSKETRVKQASPVLACPGHTPHALPVRTGISS